MHRVTNLSQGNYSFYTEAKIEQEFQQDGTVLYFCTPIQCLEPADFWHHIKLQLSNNSWQSIGLTPGEKIDRERLRLFAQLGLDIPPSELARLKNMELKDLQALVELPPLFAAIYIGYLPLIEKELSKVENPQTCLDKNGISALQVAVCTNNIEVVQFLLNNGCDVNHPCTLGISPLHIAADKGDAKMVELLLRYGAKKDLKEESGMTPAMLALKYNEFLVQRLLPEGSALEVPEGLAVRLTKQYRMPLADSSYEKLDEATKQEVKEHNRRKLLGHLFECEGLSEMASADGEMSKEVDLEGMASNHWLYHKLRKNLNNVEVNETFPASIKESLLDHCSFFEAASSRSDNDFYTRFHEGKPLTIETGYRGHNVVFFFQKINEEEAIFGVGNRHHPMKIYGMPPSLLTEDLIGEIRASEMRPEKSYEALLNRMLESCASKPELEELASKCPLDLQIVGNCVSASFESGLWLTIASQYPNDVDTATQVFGQVMQEFILGQSIRYFASHANGKNAYLPDMTLCNEIIEKTGSQISQLNHYHQELSTQFKAIPWKSKEKTEASKAPSLAEILRSSYYV